MRNKVAEIQVLLAKASMPINTALEVFRLLEEIDPVNVATNEYLKFFQDFFSDVENYLYLPDDKAIDELFQYADMYPYSWPTDQHPNFEFCLEYLEFVDWTKILKTLREMIHVPKGS